VDEFQDTDPAQYAIVRRIWGCGFQPVFLVGDPKQAIYRFRGADIYAYLAARAHADSSHVLDVNWRSDPGLVAAVNAIFRRVRTPLGRAAIRFCAARRPERRRGARAVAGEPAEPFRVWFLDRGGATTFLPKNETSRRAASATAAEIACLLRLAGDGGARLGDRPLAGGDIAGLVRNHRQGRLGPGAPAPLLGPTR